MEQVVVASYRFTVGQLCPGRDDDVVGRILYPVVNTVHIVIVQNIDASSRLQPHRLQSGFIIDLV